MRTGASNAIFGDLLTRTHASAASFRTSSCLPPSLALATFFTASTFPPSRHRPRARSHEPSSPLLLLPLLPRSSRRLLAPSTMTGFRRTTSRRPNARVTRVRRAETRVRARRRRRRRSEVEGGERAGAHARYEKAGRRRVSVRKKCILCSDKRMEDAEHPSENLRGDSRVFKLNAPERVMHETHSKQPLCTSVFHTARLRRARAILGIFAEAERSTLSSLSD